MLAVARLDGFEAQSDDGRVDEIEDRVESLRLKLRSRPDSRRRVPEESCAPKRLRSRGPRMHRESATSRSRAPSGSSPTR